MVKKITNRGEIYCYLSEKYGWTPQVIASLTPEQQEMYMTGGAVDPETERPVVKMNSIQDAIRYRNEVNR